jgi:hypothetical protein
VSSLTSFGSAGGEALQGHSKVLAILHRGAKRAILTRVKNYWGHREIVKSVGGPHVMLVQRNCGIVEAFLKYYWRMFCCDLKEIFNVYYFSNMFPTEPCGKWQ